MCFDFAYLFLFVSMNLLAKMVWHGSVGIEQYKSTFSTVRHKQYPCISPIIVLSIALTLIIANLLLLSISIY